MYNWLEIQDLIGSLVIKAAPGLSLTWFKT